MPRWLKTLYVWITRRRHRRNARRTSIRRATSYPEYRSARSSRASTPRHISRSTSPSPTPFMRPVSTERVSVMNPSTAPPLRPLSHDGQNISTHWTGQRIMTNGPIVQDPLRHQHTAPNPFAVGYVTMAGQRPPVYMIPPHAQPQFRQSTHVANPFIAPFEVQPAPVKQTPTGYLPPPPYVRRSKSLAHPAQTQALIHHPTQSSHASTSLRRPPPPDRHVRTRTRTMRQPTSSSPEQVITAWKHYQDFWERHKYGVAPGTILTFYNIPWPMLTPPRLHTSLTVSAVRAFLLSPHYPQGISPRDIVEEARLAWYPPSFMARFGAFIAPGHHDPIERTLNFLRGTLILLYEEVSNAEGAPIEQKSS